MAAKKPQGRLITQVIRTHAERHELDDDRAQFKADYPHATIRTFHRDVRADNLTFPVHIVTVREKA